MDRTQIVACVVLASLGLTGCGARSSIRVGSKNFTEQVILGEIIAQHLENTLKVAVERSLNLGGTLLAHQALVGGQIDLYPEYTGTGLAAVLKEAIPSDAGVQPRAVFERVRGEYKRRFQVTWLDPLGIDNGFAMAVRSADPVSSLSDLARSAQDWTLGVGYEFEQRADGLPALRKIYGLLPASIQTMDLGLLYKALQDSKVRVIAANATDGLLSEPAYKVLRDDKHAFPPYEISIAVREESLRANPGLAEALTALSGKFNNRQMQLLNYRVDIDHQNVDQVAREFLKAAGLQ